MEHYTLTFMHNYLYKYGGLSCMIFQFSCQLICKVTGGFLACSRGTRTKTFLHEAKALNQRINYNRYTIFKKDFLPFCIGQVYVHYIYLLYFDDLLYTVRYILLWDKCFKQHLQLFMFYNDFNKRWGVLVWLIGFLHLCILNWYKSLFSCRLFRTSKQHLMRAKVGNNLVLNFNRKLYKIKGCLFHWANIIKF